MNAETRLVPAISADNAQSHDGGRILSAATARGVSE